MPILNKSVRTQPRPGSKSVGINNRQRIAAYDPNLLSTLWAVTVSGPATVVENPVGTYGLTGGGGSDLAIIRNSFPTIPGVSYVISGISADAQVALWSGTAPNAQEYLNALPPTGSFTYTFVAIAAVAHIRFHKGLAVLATVSNLKAVRL